MKKIDEIMAEIGFQKEGSDAVKKAFVLNLIRAVKEQEEVTKIYSLNFQNEEAQKNISQEPEQLSFSFDEEKRLA